ncbi:hypothetical protein P7K49_029048, partial [Saguinus oedipus]
KAAVEAEVVAKGGWDGKGICRTIVPSSRGSRAQRGKPTQWPGQNHGKKRNKEWLPYWLIGLGYEHEEDNWVPEEYHEGAFQEAR